MTKTILRTADFSCPSCVTKVEKDLRDLVGVGAAKVHFGTGRIEVEHDPAVAPAEKLVETVRQAGYTARRSPF